MTVTSYLHHRIIPPEEEEEQGAPRRVTPSVSPRFSATSRFGSGPFSSAQPETNKVSPTLSPNCEIPAQDTNLTPDQISGHVLRFYDPEFGAAKPSQQKGFFSHHLPEPQIMFTRVVLTTRLPLTACHSQTQPHCKQRRMVQAAARSFHTLIEFPFEVGSKPPNVL